MKKVMGMGCILATAILSVWAEDFRFDSVGGHYGFSAAGRTHEFQQTEAFVNWRLPGSWRFQDDWSLRPSLGVTGGWLNQYHSDALIGGTGLNLTLEKEGFPLKLLGGAGLAWLTHTTFETKEFGTPLQFTEHVGFQVEPVQHWLIGYQYQHMSNCELSHFNPGLNLHMFSLGYGF